MANLSTLPWGPPGYVKEITLHETTRKYEFGFESRVRHGCISFGKEVGLSPVMDFHLERKAAHSLLYAGIIVCNKCVYSSVVLMLSVLLHLYFICPQDKKKHVNNN
ncbi:hypothetical protein TNCV_2207241 [Trichonephila clavipes]|uniref:Uncharacterized protein n=1 Tax=Trichonephila clavipes TaxID=2585209 RepID=A0A8X6S5R0_TRICX|nr:hypothetical protein TNCV_2207241 [Trichonephila clavipes]